MDLFHAVSRTGPLTPEQITAGREWLGLTVDELARRLRVDPQRLQFWEDGVLETPRWADVLLRTAFWLPQTRGDG